MWSGIITKDEEVIFVNGISITLFYYNRQPQILISHPNGVFQALSMNTPIIKSKIMGTKCWYIIRIEEISNGYQGVYVIIRRGQTFDQFISVNPRRQLRKLPTKYSYIRREKSSALTRRLLDRSIFNSMLDT